MTTILLETGENILLTDDRGNVFVPLGSRGSIEYALSAPAPVVVPVSETGADGPVATSEVSSPVVAQVHDLNASDLSAVSTVNAPAPGQVFAFVGDDVSSASGVSAPTARTGQSFGVNDVSSASEVASVSVGQVHAIAAEDLASAAAVDTPAAGQTHALTVDGVSAASQVDTPAAGEDSGLNANDITSASEVSSPAPGQVHALTADDVSSASSVDTPTAADVAAGGYASLQAMADDIFTVTRSGVLLAPGDGNFQERLSQSTPSGDGDVVGSIVSLDPDENIVQAKSDTQRLLLSENVTGDYFQSTSADQDALTLLPTFASATSTLMVPVRMASTETILFLLGSGGNSYTGVASDGSSGSAAGTSGFGSATTNIIEVDGVDHTSDTRDELHTAIADGSWHCVTIQFIPSVAWGFLQFLGYSPASSPDADIGPILLVDDPLTSQERTDARTILMAAVGE